MEYCYFFSKHSLDSIFLEIVGRHALSCPWTIDHERSTRTGESCTSRKPKPGLGTRENVRKGNAVAELTDATLHLNDIEQRDF